VIVGGLLLGTFFTLFIVPTAYTLLARTHRPHGTEAVPAATPHGQAAE
jgi:multidrug efflux pump